jgi:hypothetical protein
MVTFEDDTERFLDDNWSIYFHDPDDSEWTLASYKNIGTISTIQDWIDIDRAFNDMWTKGMFFVMREHIQPLWEDPKNKGGGCFSFKVNKPDVATFWFTLGSLLLGNTLGKDVENVCDDELHNSICGISMSPKRSYCILRVWIGNVKYSKPAMFNIEAPSYTHILFKTHEDNNDFSSEQT